MGRLVIDADGHVSEPPELWEEFCDPEFLAFATDYPHPDGVFPGVVKALADRGDLSEDRKDKILGLNAKRCFGL